MATKTATIGIKLEPYWNVNVIFVVLFILTVPIKLEPYWNVNFFF